MRKFQIIAIKTGNLPENGTETIRLNYLKNLEPNKIYNFNKHYSFPNGDFSNIKYDSDRDIDLYSLKLSDGREIPVNICAIVGENGSGKSALIELLYWINYNIACKLKLLEDADGEIYQPNNIYLDLLYRIDEEYVWLKMDTHDSGIVIFRLGKTPRLGPITIKDAGHVFLKDFFYSIVVNYSQYALNAKEVGDWVNPLFHKNDGYQTPIVLNPLRINGNIDINKERKLLSRRLQSNVLEPIYITEESGTNEDLENSIRNLANGKIATYFEVNYIQDYFNIKPEEITFDNVKTILESTFGAGPTGRSIKTDEIVEALRHIWHLESNREIVNIEGIEEALKKHFSLESQCKNVGFYKITMAYICEKLVKMVRQYSQYNDFWDKTNGIKYLDVLIGKIKKDNSHIAFKLKGAILHLKYYSEIYENSGPIEQGEFDPISGGSFRIIINEFSKLIQQIQEKENFNVNCYMMAFPSFFQVTVVPDIEIKSANRVTKALAIKDFSSGEKQKINALSSIVYHLINLNSVHGNSDRVSYRCINMVFDEIEMYYHPEWQRTYINDLLEYLKKINPKNLDHIEGINIFFVTHSPFILSDIPSSHILKLKDGKIENNETKTFGANIHNLLANEFLMKEGFMGEFARKKIQSLIKDLEDYATSGKLILKSKEYSQIEQKIETIGEPLIKNSLRSMLHKATVKSEINTIPEYGATVEEIQKEIERLTKLKEERHTK